MSTAAPMRTLSGFLVVGRMSGEETQETTDRWQETTDRWRDKRAQGALRSGGCFCLAILSQTHIALLLGNVHRVLKSLILLAFSHLAGARHGR